MSGSLRVMTANLWGERVDSDGLAMVIAEVDPDVLALQELAPRAVAAITERFGHHCLAPSSGEVGSGIATRFPAAFDRFSFPNRSGWSARLDPGDWPGLDHPFEVINVHFANPIGWPMWRSVATRRRELQAVTAHLGGSVSRCAVVGDFNASPMWPTYRRLARLMTDAAVATNSDRRTWRFWGHGPALLRIDHIFVQGVRATRTATVEIPGSDHRGVVADLELA